jgi:hypothetical protein
MEQRPVSVGYSPAVKFIPYGPALAAAALSLWFPTATLGAQTGERSLLRQLYGDLAFEVRTKGQGSVNVGVADARTSLVFTLLAIDLRRWSDSATRVLAARPPRRGSIVKWEAVVEGPGVTAGSMSLARTIAPGDTSIILLVTDTAFRGMANGAVHGGGSRAGSRDEASGERLAADSSRPIAKAKPPATTPPPKKPLRRTSR